MKTEQKWKIGNCLELLTEIQGKSIHMILTDLPYGETQNPMDKPIPSDKLWNQYERIIKNNGAILLFSQSIFTARMMLSNEKLYRYTLIWDKVLTSGHLNANIMPLRAHEEILVFYKNPPTYNPQKTFGNKNHSKKAQQTANNNYGEFGIVDNSKKLGYLKHPQTIITFEKDHPSVCVHPTQKPLALIEYLIKTYTNEGDTVHDSCLGSGVTLEACMNLNRNCIGFELDSQYEPFYHKRLRTGERKLDAYSITTEEKVCR